MVLGGSDRRSPSHPVFSMGRGADLYLRDRRRSRRWPRLLGGVLLVALVLGVVGGFGYWLGRRSVNQAEQPATTTSVAATSTPETTVPATTTTVRPQVYVAHAGDSLTKLAKRWNTSIAAIVELNNLQDPSKLVEGTRLKVPPPTTPPEPVDTANLSTVPPPPTTAK